MVEWIDLAVDGLEPAGAVDVADSRELRAFLFADLEDFHHVGDVVVLLEPVGDAFAQNGRRERAEAFASFDLGVQDIFHVGPARVAQDGAITEGARAPFHPALEPAYDLSVGNGLRGPPAKRAVIQ